MESPPPPTPTKTVAIIYGGKSGEHEVSCNSALFLHNMLRLSYQVHLIGVTKEGEWYWQDDKSILPDTLTIQKIRPLNIHPSQGIYFGDALLEIYCVLPITCGSNGEDGRLQAVLDIAGVRYAGCSFLSSALCMDKILLKTVWGREGIPNVPFMPLFHHEYSLLSTDEDFTAKFESLGPFPLIVKPSNGGSSIGVTKVISLDQLRQGLKEAFEWDPNCVLVEPFGAFRELMCAVVGGGTFGPEVHVYPPGEARFEGAEFLSYEAKYTPKFKLKLRIPAILTNDQMAKAIELVKKAYLAGRCEGFARVDLFVDKINANVMYVNEINTLPGFTRQSFFPKLCLNGGASPEELGKKLIEDGVKKYDVKPKTDFPVPK